MKTVDFCSAIFCLCLMAAFCGYYWGFHHGAAAHSDGKIECAKYPSGSICGVEK